jgi:hypothetical protein
MDKINNDAIENQMSMIRIRTCSNEKSLEKRFSESQNFIQEYFGDISGLQIYISCDYPECGRKYKDLSEVYSHKCLTCNRNVDFCRNHIKSSNHCVFCIIDREDESDIESCNDLEIIRNIEQS